MVKMVKKIGFHYIVQMLKYCGYHGVPMTKAMVWQYAEAICGHTLGKNWPDCFEKWHPDVTTKLTTGLQSVHAGTLNRANSSGTYGQQPSSRDNE